MSCEIHGGWVWPLLRSTVRWGLSCKINHQPHFFFEAVWGLRRVLHSRNNRWVKLTSQPLQYTLIWFRQLLIFRGSLVNQQALSVLQDDPPRRNRWITNQIHISSWSFFLLLQSKFLRLHYSTLLGRHSERAIELVQIIKTFFNLIRWLRVCYYSTY
jgi:hypothetical protein